MTDVLVVLITVPDEESARRLTETLLQERLIACANWVGPIRSRYWWDGQQEEAQEVLLLLKTTRERWEALLHRSQELHPYSVPEVLALPVATGSRAYLDWVRAETRSESASSS